MSDAVVDFTATFEAARQGDEAAQAKLLPVLYRELRELARARMKKLPPGQTLQATALVHEVYLRLVGKADLKVEGRQHFFFLAARAMRDILIEQARGKAGLKRGGGHKKVELREDAAIYEPPSDEVLAVHEALQELEKEDPVKAQIVTLRYFGGLSVEETASLLGMSERTLHRQWRFIKAWFRRRLDEPAETR